MTDANVLDNINFSIRSDEKVIIGPNQYDYTIPWYSNEPNGYRLYVEDGILT